MLNLLKINLHLFEGGAAAGGEGAGAGAAAPADSTQGATNSNPGSTRRGKSGEYANVVFGKQEGAAATGSVTNATDPSQAAAVDNNKGVQVTSNTLDEKRRAFQELVNGEYKDIYTEETQRIINRRFKETAGLQARVDETQPLVEMLMQRYGIKDGNVKNLMAAVENDDAYWSEAADEAGMTVDQYKKFQKLQRENEQLRRSEEAKRGQQFVQAQTQKWYQEAEAVKAKFPGFNFSAELKNPAFISLLKSGTPVEHAYKVLHFDELVGNAVNVTAANTQAAVVANVRARGARPQENGTAAQSAFTVKDDVSKLSKKDRAEIARRVARGEKISF